METGTEYTKEKLHRLGYFEELLKTLETSDYVPPPVVDLLQVSRALMESFREVESRLVRELLRHPELKTRTERLMTIPGMGPITGLTWALVS